MVIRAMDVKDYDDIVKQVSTMIKDNNNIAKEIVNDFINNKLITTFVMVDDEEIIGFIAIKYEPFEGANKVIEILFINIVELHRRKKHGVKLVTYVENYIRREKLRKVYVKTSITNKEAIMFWINQSYEFEVRLKDFSCEGIDTYLLSKDMKF